MYQCDNHAGLEHQHIYFARLWAWASRSIQQRDIRCVRLFQDNAMRCASHGVFAPLVGIVGTTQAAEALKLLMDIGESLQGRLLLLDALSMEWRTIKLNPDPACRVCGEGHLAAQ